jgi:hypothetical protein
MSLPRAAIFAVLFFLFMIPSPPVIAHELTGFVAAEYRLFFNDPLFDEQEKDNGSFVLQPEYYHEWENGSSFTAVPFARFDSADSERTHFDIRELNFLWVADSLEMRIGVGKVFWGVTEFVHLVDIINQTDLVENPDGEDKLGQPMVHLSIPRDWGVVDLFLLIGFREQTEPGEKGRLRFRLPVDTDSALYESAAEDHHVDFSARYSHSVGDWDLGIYHFYGTGRDPTLLFGVDASGTQTLIPFYQQIHQTGLDLQMVAGQWLLKLESLYRTGQGRSFLAAAGGFEYTWVGIFDTSMDLGLIGEYVHDDRDLNIPTIFQNDAMFGVRLAVNDMASTEVLAGFVQDLEFSTRMLSLEASRRFGDRWRATLESRLFFDVDREDVLFDLRDDDFISIELAYHF